jgi:integrase/recombinase XerD
VFVVSALERFYTRPATVDRIRAGWLGPQIEQYVEWLAAHGYAARTAYRRIPFVVAFGEFAKDQGALGIANLPSYIEAFLAECVKRRPRESRRLRGTFVSQVRVPIETMLRLVLPGYVDSRARLLGRRPFQEAAPGLFDHLERERGYRPETLRLFRHHLRAFERFLARAGVGSLPELSPVSLSAFIADSGRHLGGCSMQYRCQVLRAFLRYLYRDGITPRDLSHAVERRRSYRQAGLPRSISWPEVERVLGAVDRRTAVGKRDYAVLMLLVTYGLRARELAAMTLDDLDWKRERLHVPERKADHSTVYPLSTAVGQALADYLRDARPPVPDRHVFFRVLAPVGPLPAHSIALIASTWLRRAGVTVPRRGSHTLRHTCVQRLVEAGFSFKTIGDYVGHRSPDSTQVYGKVGVEALRELALGDGEEAL